VLPQHQARTVGPGSMLTQNRAIPVLLKAKAGSVTANALRGDEGAVGAGGLYLKVKQQLMPKP